MPICPGCERTVPYERLDVHERYCDGIWSAARTGPRSIERLEQRIVTLEGRLNRRLRDAEASIEQRLERVERATLSASEAGGRE